MFVSSAPLSESARSTWIRRLRSQDQGLSLSQLPKPTVTVQSEEDHQKWKRRQLGKVSKGTLVAQDYGTEQVTSRWPLAFGETLGDSKEISQLCLLTL